jgi:leucyl-tRNA synthetase
VAVAWDEHGIKGINRFLQRVWNMVVKLKGATEAPAKPAVLLQLHKTIKRVSESTEQFKFNTAISALMELLNVLEKEPSLPSQTVQAFVLMLAPYAPHLAEELWATLGHNITITYQTWPQFDNGILGKALVNIPVQVNGKVRGTLELPPGTGQEAVQLAAQKLPNVVKYVAGKEVVKVVFVPDRLLNLVIGL